MLFDLTADANLKVLAWAMLNQDLGLLKIWPGTTGEKAVLWCRLLSNGERLEGSFSFKEMEAAALEIYRGILKNVQEAENEL